MIPAPTLLLALPAGFLLCATSSWVNGMVSMHFGYVFRSAALFSFPFLVFLLSRLKSPTELQPFDGKSPTLGWTHSRLGLGDWVDKGGGPTLGI